MQQSTVSDLVTVAFDGPLLMKPNTGLEDLGIDDIDLLCLFLLKIDDPSGITDHLLMKIARVAKCDFDTLHQMKKRLEELSELFAETYHCCQKSCVCQGCKACLLLSPLEE